MSLARAAVLRPGDRVHYDGADYVVVALAGTSVRLRADDGAELVVLVSYLMACPEFSVTDGELLPEVEPFGLLDGLPAKVLQDARDWERHLVEVETGLPPNLRAHLGRPGRRLVRNNEPMDPSRPCANLLRPRDRRVQRRPTLRCRLPGSGRPRAADRFAGLAQPRRWRRRPAVAVRQRSRAATRPAGLPAI